MTPKNIENAELSYIQYLKKKNIPQIELETAIITTRIVSEGDWYPPAHVLLVITLTNAHIQKPIRYVVEYK